MGALARFWDGLEREARPHVEQQLARLGWVLKEGAGHRWRAERVRPALGKPAVGKGGSVEGDCIQRADPASLLDAIRRRERELGI